MGSFVNRSIYINVDPEKLSFNTTDQLLAFQSALGKMIMFGVVNSVDPEINGDIVIGKDCSDVKMFFRYSNIGPKKKSAFKVATACPDGGYAFR